MSNSMFLQLPVEIRSIVYKAFLRPYPFCVNFKPASDTDLSRISYAAYCSYPQCDCLPACKPPPHQAGSDDFIALTSTCRLVHSELVSVRDESSRFVSEAATMLRVASCWAKDAPIAGAFTLQNVRHLSVVVPVGRPRRAASNHTVEAICRFVSTTMPQLKELQLHVTLKKTRTKQHLPVSWGMVTQIREMPRLKQFRIRIGPPQRFKPQQGPLELSGRLLTSCLRAPRFMSWALCMGGSRIRRRQKPDDEAKEQIEQIDQYLRILFAACTKIILVSFRVAAGQDYLGLWHEINISQELPSPRSVGVLVD